MTHQEIVDAFAALAERESGLMKIARANIAGERDALVAECGRIGHVFSKQHAIFSSADRRACVFCMESERP